MTLPAIVRLEDRNRFIKRALDLSERLHPATLVFDGFDPVAATYRPSAHTQALRAGGFTGSAPRIYLVQKANIPVGLTITEKKTTFTHNGTRYRVDATDNEESEPQIRLTCDLANR